MTQEHAETAPPKGRKRFGRWTVSILFVIGAVLLGLSWWLMAFSGKVTIDQMVVNALGAGGEGAGGSKVVVSGIFWIAVVPLTLGPLLLTSIRKLLASDWKKSLPRFAEVGVTTALVGTLVAVPVGGAAAISSTLSIPEYIDSMTSDVSLSNYYTVPNVVATPEGEPTNLVLIYMESVEDALTDPDVFGADMLTPIEDATEGWDTITLTQPANGGWTLGGIINTQCGFPLRMANPALIGNEINNAGADVETYLPGATCLGDVLEAQGYTSVFMGGANPSFAGKGTFLANHGYGEVLGRPEWQERGETEFRKDWGLSDRRLMELAKDKVTELHEASEPFNLTLLTLDTHPDDHVYSYCDVTTENPLNSIYDCSMQQVAGFLDYMDEQGYLEDTMVVVMGDHLRLMGRNNTFVEQLEGIEGRTIFNRIWSPDGVEFAVDEIDQLSMYPTLLELLGYEIENGRAGVGVSALEDNPGPGSVRSLTQERMDELVLALSQDFYDDVWGVETSSE